MKYFDANEARELLDGDVGYRWFLSRDINEVKSLGALASNADAYLNMTVKCLLVGYDAPAQQLLFRACEWLTIAIRDTEKPQPGAHWYCNLALCNWLLHNSHDSANWQKFVKYEDEVLVGWRDKINMSMTLPGYIDAGACQRALEHFASAKLTPPASLGSIRSEGQMCYVICRHRLGQEFSEADVQTASAKFLRRNMNGWLIDGHFLRAAQWVKIVHWQEGNAGLSPQETVMKCHDYLSA